ncbi:MAG TPA: penicillin-binding transpeptidase domain-containing protein [Bryobacteraceae bacterium]|nr:penicillin-binding transpeptidase domain-containing protein [Bryobacteraceae bacterium]
MTRLALICAVAVCGAHAQNRLHTVAAPTDAGVSYLLLDATRATVIAMEWPEAAIAVPVGSLVKPFTAIAYGQRHRMRFPVHECTGEDCWLKTGHGRIGLAAAIANSCNSYFRNLTGDLLPLDVAEVADRFGLRGPAWDCDRSALFGMGSAWRLSPIEVARAYAELAARRTEPGVNEVIDGMRLGATIGTAAVIGSTLHSASAFAKTGTAPCSHVPKAAGDGYAVVVYPGDSPRYVLLVQVHGTVGRHAAETAARLLRLLVGVE